MTFQRFGFGLCLTATAAALAAHAAWALGDCAGGCAARDTLSRLAASPGSSHGAYYDAAAPSALPVSGPGRMTSAPASVGRASDARDVSVSKSVPAPSKDDGRGSTAKRVWDYLKAPLAGAAAGALIGGLVFGGLFPVAAAVMGAAIGFFAIHHGRLLYRWAKGES